MGLNRSAEDVLASPAPTGAASSPEGHRLTVAALTYRRNEDVAELLPLLVEQVESVRGTITAGSIVIVDNDPQAGARDLVQRFAATAPVTVTYLHEGEPGIAAARNCALEHCGSDDLLVFIDDDERPRDGWLQSLLATYDAQDRPAAIFGPVISVFEAEPGPWVTAGGFFDRRRVRTGTPVEVGATNNLLLDLHQVRALGLSFDRRLGISGGSDTLFSKQIVSGGGRMVWCDEAIVDDRVPAARSTRDWVLRRSLRSGNSWSRTTLMTEQRGLVTRLRLTGSGLLRVVGGTARYLVGVASRSTRHQAKGLRAVARGAGMTAGAWGFSYQEYRRRTG